MGFFGFIFVYAIRVNLSVAIVCMVNRTAIASIEDSVNSLNASNVTLTESLVDTECAGVVKSGNDTSTSDAVVSACVLIPDGDGLLLMLMIAVMMVVLVDTTPIVCLPVLSNFCLKVIYNAHCVDFRKAAWCGTVSRRQPGMGQAVIHNPHCVGFRKKDNTHCFDFRKTAWCGTMPTVLISGRQPGVGQCPLF